jgi:hypothetical protein
MWGLGLHTLRRVNRSRRAVAFVWLLLAVFVLQTAVMRGHFHVGGDLDGGATFKAGAADGGAGETKQPLPSHDESKCPLWHAAGVCGAIAAADIAHLYVPPSARLRVAADERLIFPERFAAAWRSRAPPTV